MTKSNKTIEQYADLLGTMDGKFIAKKYKVSHPRS